MRTALLGFAALTVALASDVAVANAQVPVSYPVYPWCVSYGGRNGGTNCYFSTWEQCRAAASGNNGLCYENPFYGHAGYPADRQGRGRKYRR